MARDAVVLDFPSGERRTAGGRRTPWSVAHIAESLWTGLREPVSGPSPVVPLAIRLDELSGMDDPTIARLGELARSGSLSPASAARLALRHADEVGGRGVGPASRRRSGAGQFEIETTLAGDPFGSFALGHRRGNEWVCVAEMRSVNRLHELCPADRGPVCLLVGCDAARRTTVRLLASTDWRKRLVELVAAGTIDGHVIVVGGLSPGGGRRRTILDGVERALRRGGAFELVAADRRRRLAREPSGREAQAVANLLTLIELAFPGLVDIDRDAEEARS